VVEACLLLLSNRATVDDLMRACRARFSDRRDIHGLDGVREGYRTGAPRRDPRQDAHRGYRPCARTAIIVDELPYQ